MPLALVLAVYLALAWGYATRTPIWQNPDEPAHFNYVSFVARTGGLPELRAGDWDLALLERLKNGRLEPGDDVGAIRYESWQPPLYYLVAAPVYEAGPTDPVSAVERLRLFGAVLGGLTLIIAYAVGRLVLPGPTAFGPPLVLVGIPMWTSVSASVSADALSNLLAAAVVLLLVQRLVRPRRDDPRWTLVTALVLGLGLMAKLQVGIFLPLLAVVIWLRGTRPWRDLLLAAAVVVLACVPWLVHQVTTYGPLDPLASGRHNAVVQDQQRFPGLSLTWLTQLGTITFHSFWAQFGWMGIVAPDHLYLAYGVIVTIGLAGLTRMTRIWRVAAWRLLAIACGLALVALVGYNLAFVQFQGRYLFTAVVPFACLLAAGWAAWWPRSLHALATVLLGVALVALNVYALLRVLMHGFGFAS